MAKYDWYRVTYNKLYKGSSYHDKDTCCSRPVIASEMETDTILDFKNSVESGSIYSPSGSVTLLDIGCSNGVAVRDLRSMGYDAWGIDPAPRAIEYCEKRRLTTCVTGSAVTIPFEDNSFHIIFSTDTIEHIRPREVDKVIDEFYRVATHYLVLSIALQREANTEDLDHAAGRYKTLRGLELHKSQFSSLKWIELFTRENRFEVVQENIVFIPDNKGRYGDIAGKEGFLKVIMKVNKTRWNIYDL